MHACIPRQNYGIPSEIFSFLPLFTEIGDSSQLQNDDVLYALAFYALDLVSPNSRRWARRDKKHSLAYLVTKLLEFLKNDPYPPLDVVHFVLCIIYRGPEVVHPKRTQYPLSNIARISAENGQLQTEAVATRVFASAVKAYIALLEFALRTENPKNATRFLVRDVLGSIHFVKKGLNKPSTQLLAVYAVSMALHLLPSHASGILKDIKPPGLVDILLATGATDANASDVEQGEDELENMMDLKIHTILILKHRKYDFKLNGDQGAPLIQNIGKVAVAHRNPRLRWKAIYLLVLFTPYLPNAKLAARIRTLNKDFQRRLDEGQLYVVKDWENCGLPLTQRGMNCLLEQVPKDKFLNEGAFEWVGGFPLLSLGRLDII
jgi:hypothetical protein